MVYTWGEGRRGQLGGGALENWRGRPGVVECLKGKGITRVAAGQGFSVFASDNGIVMTCGDGTFGCLGHADWNSSAKPMLIGKSCVVVHVFVCVMTVFSFILTMTHSSAKSYEHW